MFERFVNYLSVRVKSPNNKIDKAYKKLGIRVLFHDFHKAHVQTQHVPYWNCTPKPFYDRHNKQFNVPLDNHWVIFNIDL